MGAGPVKKCAECNQEDAHVYVKIYNIAHKQVKNYPHAPWSHYLNYKKDWRGNVFCVGCEPIILERYKEFKTKSKYSPNPYRGM